MIDLFQNIKRHRIDLVFPRQTLCFPLIDSVKGSDIVHIVRVKGFQNFVICKNSKNSDFYDVLFTDINDPQITALIDPNVNFVNSKLASVFVGNPIVTYSQQRMALFVLSAYNFKEMLYLRNNFKRAALFKRPEKETFLVKLPTGLVMKVKALMSITGQQFLQKIYDKMCKLYCDAHISPIKCYLVRTKFAKIDNTKRLEELEHVKKSLQLQKESPTRNNFILAPVIHSGEFDDYVKGISEDLDLMKFPANEEIRTFNATCKILRKEIEDQKLDKFSGSQLMSSMKISSTDPPLPENFPLNDRNVFINVELATKKLAVDANNLTLRIPVKYTANQTIKMILDKLKSMYQNQQNSSLSRNSSREELLNGSTERIPMSQPIQSSVSCMPNLMKLNPPSYNETNDLPSKTSISQNLSHGTRAAAFNLANRPNSFALNTANTLDSLASPANQSGVSFKDRVAMYNGNNQNYQQANNNATFLIPGQQPLSPPLASCLNPSTPGNISTPGSLTQPSIVPISPTAAPILPMMTMGETPGVQQILPPIDNITNQPPGPTHTSSPSKVIIMNTCDNYSANDELIKCNVTSNSYNFIRRTSNESEKTRGTPVNQNLWNDPNLYLLMLKENDEVLAGDTFLYHFVCVRNSILNNEQIIPIKLYNKDEMSTRKRAGSIVDRITECSPITIPRQPKGLNPKCLGYITQNICNTFIKVVIQSVSLLNVPVEGRYFVRVCLIYGQKILCKPSQTRTVTGKMSLLFNDTIELGIPLQNIPREARISMTVYKEPSQPNQQPEAAATFNHALYKFSGWLNNDQNMKQMWRFRDMDLTLTTCESRDVNPMYINFRVTKFRFPIVFIPLEEPKDFKTRATVSVPPKERQRIQRLTQIDPLTKITPEDKKCLWNYRTFCFMYPELLPLMLDSIDPVDPQQVREIPLLLKNWSRPSPPLALTLLDGKYADKAIRRYAVECIEDFTDSEIMLYLLQLVQVLKYELYEDSPLARFLIRRGLLEPKFVGHQIFWQLMSEAHLSHIRQRFSLVLVNFLYGIGNYKNELVKGFKFTQELVKLNNLLINVPYKSVQEPFREALRTIEIPKEFHLPMDPRIIVESFVIDECKVMNSKKMPFWLVFKNASPFAQENVVTMFKTGDDLRQDQLILQVMKVMEHLWSEKDKDYRMRCYGVLPTGQNQGFIEVVPHSVTESDLQQAQGTFNKSIYLNFLKQHNPTEELMEVARKNFLYSSVGYAVSTCVLGVADRHPGNIMIQRDGHFFHIDYGHFLGNFKTKNGIQCEDAPFHFINAYVKFFGGHKSIDFLKFLGEAGSALNVLRRNARLLITLLLLMTGTGIPELQKPEDINYLKNHLFLDLTDEEATQKFHELTIQSLNSWKTLLKAKVHNALTK
ncbi:Phosphatidylinositol 3- and 4-kinase family protein [Tritrichomonas foetus]|uniref:Phosphatidylinositol 3- and 4-kinase family protein n=1 Tax=Tritrichomonas foetus TaxID=1144522 RepID=A0A1J4KPF5_9EUKA|nr:Phosphatidylinositol 3- and 4-kinase family protein [Tritrichomonas foetus]|eukprot:OHT13175.1 Phosphatidylinositol 3- and 4-kinase family protein [Tritrichomonas foetus]